MPPSTPDPSIPSANSTDVSNFTLAAAAAGTILYENNSIFTTLFAYVVGGIFASFGAAWNDILWAARSPAKRRAESKKWHSAISPEGHRFVHVREKALKSNWERRVSELNGAAGGGPGLVKQSSSSGNGDTRTGDGKPDPGFEGQDEKWGDWGDYEEEKRRLDERERLRKEAGGHSGDVPKYVLEYAPLIHLYSKEEYWPGDIDLQYGFSTLFKKLKDVIRC